MKEVVFVSHLHAMRLAWVVKQVECPRCRGADPVVDVNVEFPARGIRELDLFGPTVVVKIEHVAPSVVLLGHWRDDCNAILNKRSIRVGTAGTNDPCE